ncbi:MAG TPA: hypothetical protein VHE53_01070 [Patescibacteria group bacterium]|nr:hypothetical protein [Patescibacteria group bacterium]
MTIEDLRALPSLVRMILGMIGLILLFAGIVADSLRKAGLIKLEENSDWNYVKVKNALVFLFLTLLYSFMAYQLINNVIAFHDLT